MNKYVRIDISHKTVFFITGFIALLWGLYQVREVIILLFLAIIFMSALSPIVDSLEKLRFPKALSIALSYLVIFGVITGLGYIIALPFFEQTTNLVQVFPDKVQQLLPADGPINRGLIQDELTTLSKNLLGVTLAIFNNFVAFISVGVLTFYLLLQRDQLDNLVAHFFVGHEEKARKITRRIEDKLGAWLRGQLALSLIISLLVYVVLFAIGVPYALPLAVLAGILEVVPVIGPIISAIPSVIVAYLISPVMALVVVIAFFVIQQLENNFIVPQVMKRAVGLNPLIIILAVSIGGKLLGIAGALLAVPITVVIQIIVEELLRGENIIQETQKE